jgi:Glycosyl transferase family 90
MSDQNKPTFATGGGARFTINGKLSTGIGALPAGLGTTIAVGSIAQPAGAIEYVGIAQFEQRFGCRINSLPQNVCVVGWVQSERRWYCAPKTIASSHATQASHVFHSRNNKGLLALVVREVIEPLGLSTLWFPYCFYDGWRERNVFSTHYRYVDPPDLSGAPEWHGEPGAIPILSPDRPWLGCFGAHRGDPSALLLPELHYLVERYRFLFAEVDAVRTPWHAKQLRAVLAAGDHGAVQNLVTPPADSTLHPRRVFKQTAERDRLPVDVFLGRPFSRRDQMHYRYIADVDGFARTWDAWAWKMMSGSTVLSVESIWDSFFSQQFTAWEHYVPVANDCSDLATQLEWCLAHDAECEAIASRARARAEVVYSAENVTKQLRSNFEARLMRSAASPTIGSTQPGK